MKALTIRKLLPLAAWGMVGLVFTTQLYLFVRRTGGSMGWIDAFVWEVPRWLLWAFLAPIVRRLAVRYPVGKDNAVRRIAAHTLYGALVSMVHLILFVLVFHVLRLWMGNSGELLETFQFAFPLDFHVGIAVYWLIVLLRQFTDSEQRIARMQVELTQAQLSALKMQLHPHFLFNTLNSISSFLRKDVEVADEMIGRLGDFLRLTLQNPGSDEISLEKELEFLRRYLEIEQLRFEDRLLAQFDVAPDTLSALVPNLILQPVVENAVRHGVSEQTGLAMIRISAKRLNGRLQIVVTDNGRGLPQQITHGIGIAATRDRLARMYGEQARFDLANQAEGGAVVTLEIPYRTSETA
ncbi:MAG TPA: histidine kinase [Acidobacteriota bacterium]